MWWKNAVFYEIYLASFADSNGDGIGDIDGVREKLPYLKECGIDALWLTPFYPSPRVDNGYDVSDYCAVDPQYGTLENFRSLLEEAHALSIKVIIDVVLKHTSTAHPWFMESSASQASAKRDWYIWRDQSNNWESFFGGSAWKMDRRTNQYYYHSFAEEQADLNWQNPEVKQAIYDVLSFWLDMGVDGFRFDVINNLTVNDTFTDNPRDEEGKQVHLYDVNQPGVMPVLKEMNQWLKTVAPNIFTVAEISSDQLSVISSYVEEAGFDTAFNFNLGSIETLDLTTLTHEFQEMNARKHLPTLFFNSHDMSRSWNRLAQEDRETYELLSVFLLINRGVPFLFQGEEQGVSDFYPTHISEIRDIQAKNKYHEQCLFVEIRQALSAANEVNRDRSRGMIPWGESQRLGWIGTSPKNPEGELISSVYQELIRLRKAEGPFQEVTNIQLEKGCIRYQVEHLSVVLNFSESSVEQNISENVQMIYGKGMLSEDRKWVNVPSKSCWIGKE